MGKISKRKIVVAIELFEKNIDETISDIKIYDKNNYVITTDNGNYSVDISNNEVSEVMSDIWDD